MGYEKKEYKLLELSPKDINIIRLKHGVLSLTEAVVKGKKRRKLSAHEIVRKAIENISKNYPLNNFTVKGYYRDYQLDSLGYVNLNEALVQVYDSGFNEMDTATTKARIYDYIQNQDFRRDTLADDSYNYKNRRKVINNAYLRAYGGNEFQILRVHDAIRNYKMNSYDFINNLKEGDILKNHSLESFQIPILKMNNCMRFDLESYIRIMRLRGFCTSPKTIFQFINWNMLFTMIEREIRTKY